MGRFILIHESTEVHTPSNAFVARMVFEAQAPDAGVVCATLDLLATAEVAAALRKAGAVEVSFRAAEPAPAPEAESAARAEEPPPVARVVTDEAPPPAEKEPEPEVPPAPTDALQKE